MCAFDEYKDRFGVVKRVDAGCRQPSECDTNCAEVGNLFNNVLLETCLTNCTLTKECPPGVTSRFTNMCSILNL